MICMSALQRLIDRAHELESEYARWLCCCATWPSATPGLGFVFNSSCVNSDFEQRAEFSQIRHLLMM